ASGPPIVTPTLLTCTPTPSGLWSPFRGSPHQQKWSAVPNRVLLWPPVPATTWVPLLAWDCAPVTPWYPSAPAAPCSGSVTDPHRTPAAPSADSPMPRAATCRSWPHSTPHVCSVPRPAYSAPTRTGSTVWPWPPHPEPTASYSFPTWMGNAPPNCPNRPAPCTTSPART